MPDPVVYAIGRTPRRAVDPARPPIRSVSVCVPAKNEAARLPDFFDALAPAIVRAQLSGLACEVAIALDGCTDASFEIVAARALSFPCPVRAFGLPAHPVPHAGRARRAAMEAGLEGVAALRSHALLTTDADTRVDGDWIAASAHALAHTDLVAGWVDWDGESEIADLVAQEDYFSELHRLRRRIDPVAFDAADPHHKMYGASLSIRASAYRAVGGLPELASSEDVALTRAVRLAGLRMRQDRDVRVLTSTRRSGRATGGFSDAILSDTARAARGEPQQVEDPDALVGIYRTGARLRAAFEAGDRDLLEAGGRAGGAGTDIPDFEFEQAWAGAPSADAFVTRLTEPLHVDGRVSLAHARARVRDMHDQLGRSGR